MERKDLSADALIDCVRRGFSQFHDHRLNSKNIKISLTDTCMSAFAMFSLKMPSLLSFINLMKGEGAEVKNLKTLYKVKEVPSDTQMRTILDEIKTEEFRPIYKDLFGLAQRGGVLKNFEYSNGYYLAALDGTGCFSSTITHCGNCLEKKHRLKKEGNSSEKNQSEEEIKKITYSHQIVGAAIVHPSCKQIIPLCPEPIQKQDGAKKNDCERNSTKRLLYKIKEDHPRLKLIIIEDGLASNAPHIRTIMECGFSYILGAKPGDHKYLFDWVSHDDRVNFYEELNISGDKIKKYTTHKFKFINNVPLNEASPDLLVNFLDYEEITEYKNPKTGEVKTEKKCFTWVTDFEITEENIMRIMKGGRARWKIENEVFNTLKNQGYQLEHNFGHGFKNLCNNFIMIMMLAFLIDQLQELCCSLFKKALAVAGGRSALWKKMQAYFQLALLSGWNELLNHIGSKKFFINSA